MGLTIVKGRDGRFAHVEFRGGVNLAAHPSEVPEGQFPAGLNLTSEGALGGGLVSRFGCKDTATTVGAGNQAYIIGWSPTLNLAFVQHGASLHKINLTTLAATNLGAFSTSATGRACEFGLEAVICHPADGVFTYDGVTLTLRSAAAKGNAIAAWQNIVWVAGDTATNTRIFKSAVGDAHTWVPDYIDIRDIDTAQLRCLIVGQGMDIQGRPGLLVAKGSSLYRVNTPSTGAYSAISPSVGAQSAFAMCALDRFVYLHGGGGSSGGNAQAGIWRTDGINAPELVSGAIQPLFNRGSISLGWVVALRGRLYCNVPDPSGGAGYVGEYDPALNAWFLHKTSVLPVAPLAAAGFSGLLATYASTTGRLGVFFDNGAFASTYLVGTDANDDGDSVHSSIAATLQTRWSDAGVRVKTQRARVRARGASVSFGQRNDYSVTQVADRTLTVAFSSSTVKDTDVVVPLGSYKPCRAFAFDVTATTSSLGSAQAFNNALGGSSAASVGAWGIEAVSGEYVQLGI